MAGNPDISVSRPLPFTLSTDRLANTHDVIVELNTTGSRWNYLANPFAQPLDLIDADTWPGYFGISSPPYVYDPATRSWEDSPLLLQPWQGVRVRSKGPRNDGSGRSLRIPASAQVPTGGIQARCAETPALAFRLDGTDALGLALADAAFTVAFDDAATLGLDAEVDVEKLQTPSTQYVSIGSRVDDAYLGYDVRPFADAEIPLALDTRGAASDLTLQWDATTLPAGLPVVLVDLVTGAEVDVRAQASYTFEAMGQPALAQEPTGDTIDHGDATDRFVLRIGERVATTTDDDAGRALRLEAPRPNPSAGTARVVYSLPEAGVVRLSVVDMRGREVATLVNGARAAGWHEAQVDAGSLATGVYGVRLTAGSDVATQRLVVVR